jgi:hypothetical protein
MIEEDDKVYENRVRRHAARLGYQLRKSRAQRIHLDNHGEYMLVDVHRSAIVMGERFNADLDDIEKYLDEAEANVIR